MRIYDGSPRQDFEEVLRSIGAFLDQRGMRDILLVEAPDGFIVQGLVVETTSAGAWSDLAGHERKETLTFLRATGSAPGLVGAIAPSGAALARLITSEIGCGSGHVVEFGPGTGVFTRALLDQGMREKDLTLVEYRSDFAKLLQERFPGPAAPGETPSPLTRLSRGSNLHPSGNVLGNRG